MQVREQMSRGEAYATARRSDWVSFDPQLISEALFATANIFSILKLIHFCTVRSHLVALDRKHPTVDELCAIVMETGNLSGRGNLRCICADGVFFTAVENGTDLRLVVPAVTDCSSASSN